MTDSKSNQGFLAFETFDQNGEKYFFVSKELFELIVGSYEGGHYIFREKKHYGMQELQEPQTTERSECQHHKNY